MENRIERAREKIERRRALASSCTTRPLSAAGGGSSGGDASMKLINYVAQIEELEGELARLTAERELIRSSCFYLADMLPEKLASVALRYYLEGATIKEISGAMHYSQTQIRRWKESAEEALERLTVLAWDRTHLPILGDARRGG